MLTVLLALVACPAPTAPDPGVYKSGPNAVVSGVRTEPLKVWGPQGTVTRVPSQGAAGSSLLGEAGPLWVVDREVPGVEKGGAVPAAIVERAGFRLREVLGSKATTEIDPARGSGVSLRSMVKVRREFAPPVYLAVATAGAHGIPGAAGPSPVLDPSDCSAAVAVLDDDAGKTLSWAAVPQAERTCAVPVLLPPVDIDGEGTPDVLVYGQRDGKGFRVWFQLGKDNRLTAGPASVWEAIP